MRGPYHYCGACKRKGAYRVPVWASEFWCVRCRYCGRERGGYRYGPLDVQAEALQLANIPNAGERVTVEPDRF